MTWPGPPRACACRSRGPRSRCPCRRSRRLGRSPPRCRLARRHVRPDEGQPPAVTAPPGVAPAVVTACAEKLYPDHPAPSAENRPTFTPRRPSRNNLVQRPFAPLARVRPSHPTCCIPACRAPGARPQPETQPPPIASGSVRNDQRPLSDLHSAVVRLADAARCCSCVGLLSGLLQGGGRAAGVRWVQTEHGSRDLVHELVRDPVCFLRGQLMLDDQFGQLAGVQTAAHVVPRGDRAQSAGVVDEPGVL